MTDARLAVYDPNNTTYRGILNPVKGTLRPTHEIGSAGTITFGALQSELDTLDGWDSVVRLQVWDGDSWVTGPAYAIRPPFTRDKVTPADVDSVWKCDGSALLEQWAAETTILPEYVVGAMPRGAGVERGIGWMSSAYAPGADPNEPWAGCYETARTVFPTGWPTAAAAKWISVTGATDTSERKLFRTHEDHPLTITEPKVVRFYFTSDESGTVFVAGDPLPELSTSSVETGRTEFSTVELVMMPGEYGVSIDTATDFTKGGDGVDPVALAVCTLDDDGDPDTWLLVTDDTAWVACRRDDEPPANEPPGPTPGAMIRYLVEEAAERGCTGWAGVTLGFTDTHDSYAEPWSTVVVERVLRVGQDTYWTVFQALAEAGEADVWLDADNTLHAAPQQRTSGGFVLDDTMVRSCSDTKGGAPGTWCAGLARDGWVNGATGSVHRREFAVELGTALTRATADRVVIGALSEAGRRDFRAKLIPITGKVPLVDYNPGNVVGLGYGDVDTSVIILSISADPGDGGLLWEAELLEVLT